MKIFVKAKTGAKEARIDQIDDVHFNVAVKERPIKGKANEAIRKSLAKHLRTSQSHITLHSGLSSKQKVFYLDK